MFFPRFRFMKVIKKALKQGTVVVKIENMDDLWHLSQLVEASDQVRGKTSRKLKLGSDSETTRKTMTLTIKVESTELTDHSLRIHGTTTESTDDVPAASHHTITAETNYDLTIIKKEWPQFHLQRLDEASKEKNAPVLITVFDREQAVFASLKSNGYKVLSTLTGNVTKKFDPAIKGENFYNHIIKTMQEYADRLKVQHIILASPSFWKEELMKELKDDTLKKKIIQATCSSADQGALDELLKRPELAQVLADERAAKEAALVERLLEQIAKDGLAVYGPEQVQQAIDAGAVETLLVSSDKIKETREDDVFEQLNAKMKAVDSQSGQVSFITSSTDAGKKLDGLGGLAALLRYQIN